MTKLYFVARTDVSADSGEQRVFGATYGWTSGQIDAYFRAASVL
jgi:hypothetical protein